jgi:outer membrane protein
LTDRFAMTTTNPLLAFSTPLRRFVARFGAPALRWTGLLLLATALVGLPAHVQAQDAQPDTLDQDAAMQGASMQDAQAQSGRTITFSDAVRIALDQNTDIKRAANNVAQQDAILWQERMDFAPSLGLSINGSQSFGRQFIESEGQIISTTTNTLSGGAQSSINVFNGFNDIATLQAAGLRGQSATLDLERTRQDVIFEVMNRYIALVENREIERVRREELEARRQQLEQTREFVEAGRSPESDLFQQQANVAQAESDLLSAEREVQLSKTRLIQTLQLDPLGDYQFETPTVSEEDLMGTQYDPQDLLRRAMDRRPDLRAQQIQTQAADQDVRAAQSGYYPSISVSFGYGSDWSSRIGDTQVITDQRVFQVQTVEGEVINEVRSIPVGEQPLSFLDKLDQRRGGSFRVSLSWSIFDRLNTRTQVKRARVQEQNAEYALQDQRQQIALQVRQAYLDYQNAQKQLDVAQTRLRSARRAREAAQERYNLGAAPIVELSQANADFVSAASQRVRARYNFILQKKLIDYYLGVMNPQEALFR